VTLCCPNVYQRNKFKLRLRTCVNIIAYYDIYTIDIARLTMFHSM